jgi:hypothetical protein
MRSSRTFVSKLSRLLAALAGLATLAFAGGANFKGW